MEKKRVLRIGSAHSKMPMKFVKKKKKVKVIFQPIHDLRSKKQRKSNLIQSEGKVDIKDKFLDSGADQKKSEDSPQTRTPTESERGRGET